MEQAEDVFTTARHTKHTDVKDGTLVGIQFLIGLIAGAPRVLILQSSHRVPPHL